MYANERVLLNCPFAVKIGSDRITCEGLMGASTVSLSFQSPKKCTAVVYNYCANPTRTQAYRKCPIAAALEKEYGV